MKITKAIIAAAGYGTRFLPATKNQPKEMLPIVDKPIIHYLVEEAVESGIEDIIIVKYEDLKEDTEEEIKKVLDFIDLSSVNDEFIKEVVEFSSIERMKNREAKKQKGRKKIQTVHEGQAHRYKDYFSNDDLEYFRDKVKNKLNYNFGYDYGS